MNIHKQYSVYFETQRSRIISNYLGLNQGPSDPEADNIPLCLGASLIDSILLINLFPKMWLTKLRVSTFVRPRPGLLIQCNVIRVQAGKKEYKLEKCDIGMVAFRLTKQIWIGRFVEHN